MSAPVGFSAETAVRAVDGLDALAGAGEALFEAVMDPGYWIINGPNGGYIAAIMARAVVAACDAGLGTERPPAPGRLKIATISLHYLRAPAAGPVVVEVTAQRVGRRAASFSVAMRRDHQTLVHGIASLVAVDVDEPVVFHDSTAPDWVTGPLPEPPSRSGLREPIAMRDKYDTRPVIGGRFLAIESGEVLDGDSAPARAGGFIRPAVPQPVDEFVLIALCDAWWPPIFERFGMTVGAVPTVEMTVHIEHPLPLGTDPVAVEFYSASSDAGFTIEDGSIWDRAGRQLARSRQIAIVSSSPPLS